MTDDNHLQNKVDLREYIERIMDEREKRIYDHFRANKEALDLARKQIDYRLKGMNEFQKRMDRLESTFATKEQLALVSRLVYIGVGIVVAFQFFIYIIKWW